MPRIRSLKYEYFINEDLAQISLHARLLGLGLTTLADREGRLEDRPLRIKVLLFPYHDIDVDKALDELQDAGFLSRYTVDGKRYIAVVNFLKHQRPHPREVASVIPSPEKASPRQAKVRPVREKAAKPDDPCPTQPGGLGDLGHRSGTSVDRKPSAHAELMKFLEVKIGVIPNPGKEGKDAKWLLENGYDVVECKRCWEDLAAEPWRTTPVNWTTVRSNIANWLKKHPVVGKASTVPAKVTLPRWNCQCGFYVLAQNGTGPKTCPECKKELTRESDATHRVSA